MGIMNEQASPKIIVAMPAYNEQKYIGSIVLLARPYADEVVVVDDGSADNTSKIAELAGATVVRHADNKGYGSSIQRILAEAKKQKADILVILDADAQHDPDEIPVLTQAIHEGFDIVIGSREIQKSAIPRYRRLGQKVLAKLTNIASRQRLSDTESGFRAYSKKAIATLELKENGMAVSAEIVSEASRKGLKITEVPISARYTKEGSTLNPVIHGLGNLNRIMVMISERRPLLFFSLAGGILIAFGIVAGVGVVQTYYTSYILATGTALISMLLITIGVLCIFTGIILSVLAKRLSK